MNNKKLSKSKQAMIDQYQRRKQILSALESGKYQKINSRLFATEHAVEGPRGVRQDGEGCCALGAIMVEFNVDQDARQREQMMINYSQIGADLLGLTREEASMIVSVNDRSQAGNWRDVIAKMKELFSSKDKLVANLLPSANEPDPVAEAEVAPTEPVMIRITTGESVH